MLYLCLLLIAVASKIVTVTAISVDGTDAVRINSRFKDSEVMITSSRRDRLKIGHAMSSQQSFPAISIIITDGAPINSYRIHGDLYASVSRLCFSTVDEAQIWMGRKGSQLYLVPKQLTDRFQGNKKVCPQMQGIQDSLIKCSLNYFGIFSANKQTYIKEIVMSLCAFILLLVWKRVYQQKETSI